MGEHIAIVGAGYVGLVGGACFAQLGNTVVCSDIDRKKVTSLQRGVIPFYEPDVSRLFLKNKKRGRISCTVHIERALEKARFIFICVGTPPKRNGSADLTAYFQAIKDIKRFLEKSPETHSVIVVNKSTVPIGTAREADKMLSRMNARREVVVASNPEFLREGRAVRDFLQPDRVIIGCNEKDRQRMRPLSALYASFESPKLIVNWETAEMIKYASNAYLAAKISFINEIAHVCERVGANVLQVAEGMGYDERIGRQFLRAGIGYGGSCFPKDVRALHFLALNQKYNFKLLMAVISVNADQRMRALDKIEQALGGALERKKIAVLGLSFKPETDDIRESASISIIKEAVRRGARVSAYDPAAGGNAKRELKNVRGVIISKNAYHAVKGADLLFLATDWKEFLSLDFHKVKRLMRGNHILDGRNVLNKVALAEAGFYYQGFGVVSSDAPIAKRMF